jgi:hypothetical protein
LNYFPNLSSRIVLRNEKRQAAGFVESSYNIARRLFTRKHSGQIEMVES